MTKLHYKTDEGFQEIDFVPESVSSESIHGDSLTIGEEITVGPSDMEHVEITQNSIETFYENRVLGSTITSIGGTEPITMTNRSGYSALSTTCYVDSNHIDEYGQIKVTYTVLKKDSTKITSETSKISIDLMGCSIESNT